MSYLPPTPGWAEYAAYLWATETISYNQIGDRMGRSGGGICAAINAFLMRAYPKKVIRDPVYDFVVGLSVWGRQRRELAQHYFADRPPPPVPPPRDEPTAIRNRRIYVAYRRDGKTFAQIGREHRLSKARVGQIVNDVEWKIRRAQRTFHCRAPLARIQDPDPAQRDVWLSFTVPPDPRLDSMEPVR